MIRPHAILFGPLLLGACASYAPAPLAEHPAVLDMTTTAALARANAGRPYLQPVAIDLSLPLDDTAIATLAVLANPDLRAQRSRVGVEDAQVFNARLLPDPTLSLGASGVLAGPDPLIDLVAALGFDLAGLRTRGVQLTQVRAARQQVRLDLAWAEWQTAGQARLQAVRIVGLARSVALTEASRGAARALFERTARAAGRGDIAADQLQGARLAAADAEGKARSAEKDLAVARFELTRLLGLPPATALRLTLPNQPDQALDARHLYEIARASRTDLQALEAGYAAQEAAVHKAVLDQFPTLGLTLNANRDTSGNTIVGPAVDFTLPLWNRNRGGIAVEQATRAALKAEYDARLFQTRAEIAAAVSGIAVARWQRDAARGDLPATRRFAEAMRHAAERGDVAAAAAETAEQALRDKQILLLQSEQDIAEQMIALEMLTGMLRQAWT